jgi:beta-lactamase regulating signal transducer with metallopeptidase domain
MPGERPVEQLAWVLFHFMWQGALIAVVAQLFLLLLHKRSADLRYIAACMALLALALAPAATFLQLDRVLHTAPLILPAEWHPEEAALFADDSAGGAAALRVNPFRSAVARATPLIQPYMKVIVAGWLIACLLLLARQFILWLLLWRFVRVCCEPLRRRLPCLEEVAGRLHRRRVVFRQTDLLEAPATLGFLQPVVLVPRRCLQELTVEQLKALVAHELAHIRRRDFAVNVLQSVVETVLFFHPAVWWASRRIRIERENCCDDLAAKVTGDQKVYARSLAAVELMRSTRPRHALSAQGASVVARIDRLLRNSAVRRLKREPQIPSVAMASLVLLALISVMLLASDPQRLQGAELEQIPSVSSRLYAILSVPASEDTFLPVLAEAIVQLKTSAAVDSGLLERLAESILTGSQPDALALAAAHRMQIEAPYAYQSASDWRYGTYSQIFCWKMLGGSASLTSSHRSGRRGQLS